MSDQLTMKGTAMFTETPKPYLLTESEVGLLATILKDHYLDRLRHNDVEPFQFMLGDTNEEESHGVCQLLDKFGYTY